MYTVGVRDHFMVAHSLRGEVFGPAQRLHGATYALTVEVEREELDEHGIVVDIGKLREVVRRVANDLDYRNLDDHPAFAEVGSTTEHIARHVHREVGRAIALPPGTNVTITLEESPAAFARYRAPIRGGDRLA
jgi:6-pyruvoyl tetrahydropterin synthase/QueD family protein